MSGWIALHREAIEHPLLQDGDRFRAWCWLILKAAWRPTPFDLQGRTIILERGQLCTSRHQLAKAWSWAPSTAERFLARLEAEGMIIRATGQGRTVITICNYAKFQDVTGQTGQALDPDRKPDKRRTSARSTTGQAKQSASAGFHVDISGDSASAGQAPGNASDANRTSNRTTKEPSNHKPSSEDKSSSHARARGAAAGDELSNLEISAKVWADFREHRRRIKAPLTARAEELVLKKLEKLHASGNDPTAVLEQSIENGWKGVFPIRADRDGGQSRDNGRGLFNASRGEP